MDSGDSMDGFNTKFIKLVDDIKNGEILTIELDKYIKDNSSKNIFSKALVSLMDNKDEYIKIFSSRYAFDYNIDKKKAYFNSRLILRQSTDVTCRLEAKYIYDRYKRRHLTKITKLIKFRKK